ncbi:MAG: hypothetical protein IKP95_11365 [Ruminococcus sp.]|nr:hypothetical protein [Ruminococcus sp.]
MEENVQAQTATVKKKKPLRRRLLLLFLILMCILLLLFIVRDIYDIGARRSIAGIGDPVQKPVSGEKFLSSWGFDVKLTYEYEYEIEGLVVHTRRYFGPFSMADAISPMDVALAWGKVAEKNTLIDFGWEHTKRALIVDADPADDYEIKLIGGMDYVISHCSNNHLIPASFRVSHDIKKIRRGDHVKLKGYLVSAYGSRFGNSYAWETSTVRDDHGKTGCEIIYVTDVQFLE